MTPNKIALALALAAFALPMSALAQDAAATEETAEAAQDEAPAAAADEAAEEEEAGSGISWNLAVTSDYVFRGISQSDFDPALQAGADYSFGDTGLYVGAWASNVDFADSDGPDIELDWFIGWNHDLSDTLNLDLQLVRYSYMGEQEAYGNIDYNEVIGALAYDEMLTFTVAYANNYSNADISSLYYNLSGSWDVGNDFAVNAGVGRTHFSDDVGGYNDWNIGVSRQFGPVNVALDYHDATGSVIDELYGDEKASDRVVLTLSFGD
jgi:uncharacterized protein (TIGR02001 family)